jgi:hypothetical protein
LADWYQGALGYYVYYNSSTLVKNDKKRIKRVQDEEKTSQTIALYQKYINQRMIALKNKNLNKSEAIQKVFDSMSENKIHESLWNNYNNDADTKKAFIKAIRDNVGNNTISEQKLEQLLNFNTDTQTIIAQEQNAKNDFDKIKLTKIQTSMKKKIIQNNQKAQKEETEVEYKHIFLSTLIRRAEELKTAIESIADEPVLQNKLKNQTANLIKNIKELAAANERDYDIMVKLDKKQKKNIMKLALEAKISDNNQTTIQALVNEINKIAAAAEAAIIIRINAAISEIIGSLIAENIRKMSATALTEFLQHNVAGGKTVSSALTNVNMILSKEFVEESKEKLKEKKIKKNVKVNDQYQYDFGATEVQNKIDFFLTLTVNNAQQRLPISYKRYSFNNQKDFPHISLSSSTSLLAYLGAIQAVNTKQNMGTEIINALTDRRKKGKFKGVALTSLKKQIIYSALTGELGGRMLLNNNKAEFLVIENANTPSKKKVYSIGELLDNLEIFNLEPKEDNWRGFFEQQYQGNKNIPTREGSFMRISKILTNLRGQKIAVGLKKQAVVF